VLVSFLLFGTSRSTFSRESVRCKIIVWLIYCGECGHQLQSFIMPNSAYKRLQPFRQGLHLTYIAQEGQGSLSVVQKKCNRLNDQKGDLV
jgi:hypothetical protein